MSIAVVQTNIAVTRSSDQAFQSGRVPPRHPSLPAPVARSCEPLARNKSADWPLPSSETPTTLVQSRLEIGPGRTKPPLPRSRPPPTAPGPSHRSPRTPRAMHGVVGNKEADSDPLRWTSILSTTDVPTRAALAPAG